MPGVIGRIPSTLEKYRHAVSAWLEELDQYSFQREKEIESQGPVSFLNLSPHEQRTRTASTSSPVISALPDAQMRIDSAHKKVRHELNLLISNISWIRDDLHGDFQLIRSNIDLLSSQSTQYLIQRRRSAASSSADVVMDSDNSTRNRNRNPFTPNNYSIPSTNTITNTNTNTNTNANTPTHTQTSTHSTTDNILNAQQKRSMQRTVSILHKFIESNRSMVDCIQKSQSHLDSLWVHNDTPHSHDHSHHQIHRLRQDIERIVIAMNIKNLIETKSTQCHEMLIRDILGCADTKKFFTRIYFIVSIWYRFLHEWHAKLYHPVCDHEDHKSHSSDLCEDYLTNLFAMTSFSFLTNTEENTPEYVIESEAARLSMDAEVAGQSTPSDIDPNVGGRNLNPHRRSQIAVDHQVDNDGDGNRSTVHGQVQASNGSDVISPGPNSTESANASHCKAAVSPMSALPGDPNSMNTAVAVLGTEDTTMTTAAVSDGAVTADGKKPDDFLLKYLKAQNTYLNSIAGDGIALLEYSHHLMQQQEYRKAVQVGYQCMKVFMRQKEAELARQRQERQHRNWNGLQQDLYGPDADEPFPIHGGLPGSQIPGLWYIEIHLANCYQQWGDPRRALYHIERTLKHLGHYEINPNTLTVRLNAQSKFRPLSSYLVQDLQARDQQPRQQLPSRNSMPSPPSSPGVFQPLVAAQSRLRRLQSNVTERVRAGAAAMGATRRNASFNSNSPTRGPRALSMSRASSFGSARGTTAAATAADETKDDGSHSAASRTPTRKERLRQTKKSFISRLKTRLSPNKKERGKDQREEAQESKEMEESHMSCDSGSRSGGGMSIDEDDDDESVNSVLSLCNDTDDDDKKWGSLDGLKLEEQFHGDLIPDLKMSESVDNESDEDDVELHLEQMRARQMMNGDMNTNHQNGRNMSGNGSGNGNGNIGVMVQGQQQQHLHHQNQQQHQRARHLAAEVDGSVIGLDALLSMHMTKGRILTELSRWEEAKQLYSYIIGELEAMIKYHMLVNPQDVEALMQYESARRRHQHMWQQYRNRVPPKPHTSNTGAIADNDTSTMTGTGMSMQAQMAMQHQSRRRNTRRGSNFAMVQAPRTLPPPRDTPFRRLTRDHGLENYYAARGDIYFKFKDLKKALQDFTNAIKYGANRKEMGIYYNLRGVCYHEMRDYEHAIRDYDNAVRSSYGNHVAWNNRAALLVDMRKYDDAIAAANKAIQMDPSYGNAYKHRGVAYHLKCEFEKAITDINRCIMLLPNYRPARLALQSIWNDVFGCVRVVNGQGVPLELIKIVVDFTVGNSYEDDEDMVNFTYC